MPGRPNSPQVKARFIEPTLALSVSAPTGPECFYELKLDGYRALRLKSGGYRAIAVAQRQVRFLRNVAIVSAGRGGFCALGVAAFSVGTCVW